MKNKGFDIILIGTRECGRTALMEHKLNSSKYDKICIANVKDKKEKEDLFKLKNDFNLNILPIHERMKF